jgi:adenylate kinase family enzyme
VNILIFGPNGSGKGTQGAIVQKKYGVPHIETGVIFRQNISRKTPLGEKAKEYIDKGELVPDDITIPMILNRLKEDDCKNGWLLDGFPRNLAQAEALAKALEKERMKLDYVIEIDLDRGSAKKELWGADCAKQTTIIPIIFSLKPSNRPRKTENQFAGFAVAKNSRREPTIRTKQQLISVIIFITIPRPGRWLQSIILKKEQK